MTTDSVKELVDSLCLKVNMENNGITVPDYLTTHIEDLKDRLVHYQCPECGKE